MLETEEKNFLFYAGPVHKWNKSRVAIERFCDFRNTAKFKRFCAVCSTDHLFLQCNCNGLHDAVREARLTEEPQTAGWISIPGPATYIRGN